MNEKPKGLFSNLTGSNDKDDTVKYLSDNLVDMEVWCREHNVSFDLMKKLCIDTNRLYYKISGNYFHHPADLLQCYNDSLTASKVNLEKKIKSKKTIEAGKRALLTTINNFFQPNSIEDIEKLDEIFESIFKKGEIIENWNDLNSLAAERSEQRKKEEAEKLLKEIDYRKKKLDALKNDSVDSNQNPSPTEDQSSSNS
ncbi:MAG: hypothetical protein RL498_681 [Pseudomonadota bacterium]|jgi:hypothetical protein